MKKKKGELILIHTGWWSGIYCDRKLVMQTTYSPNSSYNIKPEFLPKGALGPIKRIMSVRYIGILPENLDDLKVVYWRQGRQCYRKVCP